MYVGCDNFSHDYALPPVKHDLIVGGVEDQVRGEEMVLMLALGCRASSLRSEKARCCREAAGMSIVDADGPCSW